jgi:hypothetical protein
MPTPNDRTDNALLESLPFHRSYRGNLTCRVRDLTVTVFARGGYHYCIAKNDEPSYSEKRYDTEAEAVAACEAAVREVLADGD